MIPEQRTSAIPLVVFGGAIGLSIADSIHGPVSGGLGFLAGSIIVCGLFFLAPPISRAIRPRTKATITCPRCGNSLSLTLPDVKLPSEKSDPR